jgi:hypothetical protein
VEPVPLASKDSLDGLYAMQRQIDALQEGTRLFARLADALERDLQR